MNYSVKYWEDVEKVIPYIPHIEKLKGKKILITGATGMICSSVVEILFFLNQFQGADISICLAGRSEERLKKRFQGCGEYKYIKYDALKTMDIKVDVDYIIHGAGNSNPTAYANQPVETLLGNIIGLNSLLKMVSESNVQRILYISSSEVYGNKTNNCPYEENDYGFVDVLNPRSCYPNGKRAAETLCISYSMEYNVDTVIVRPGHIYGPTITVSDNRATAQFTRNVLSGQDIVMKSAGMQLRSYCYTLDCASAILTVLLNGQKGNAYNISNRDSVVTIRAIAEAFANYGNTDIVFENPSDIELKGYNLMSNSALDANKLESLGWNAAFNLEEGVKSTIDHMKYRTEDI